MGIGVSIFLVAVGAVLAFAVNFRTSGLDISTVGVILMIVGSLGFVASLVMLGGSGWGGRRRTVVDDYEPVGHRVVRREEIV